MADSQRICSVAGCDKPHDSKGFCSKHYERWRKHGDPLFTLRLEKTPRGSNGVCTIDGCSRDAINSRGWCSKHHQRWQKNGDPLLVKLIRTKPGQVCMAEGCDGAVSAKGLCVVHYSRLRKHGSHEDDALSPRYRRREKWLNANAAYSGEDCLIWPFSVGDHGRGQTVLNGKSMSAPRAMCTLAHGEPPTEEHHAAHSCGNGHLGCISPKHLRWATPAENEADKLAHGTLRRGTKINTNKLTEDDVRKIRASVESGVSLARRYSVTPSAISSIRTGKSWRWLK